MPTISKENYLKTVYLLVNEGGKTATTSEIAVELAVSNAATSEMAKKLGGEGLVEYTRYQGVLLTQQGEKIALQVIRKHRLWELFLTKSLGLTWGEVHAEAEGLEHHSSDFLIDKIDGYLGYPKFDPHGSPIPDASGKLPKQPEIFSLAEVEKGKSYKIASVNDKNDELMKYFTKIGVELNEKVEVTDKLEFDNSVTVKLGGSFHALSEKIAGNIFVTEE